MSLRFSFNFSLHSSLFLERACVCVSLLLHHFETFFLRKDDGFSWAPKQRREREREKERDRLRIRIIFALLKALFRFPGNSSLSLCETHECLLSLLRVVFSRWSRRKKERECAKEENKKNKRDDTEHRLWLPGRRVREFEEERKLPPSKRRKLEEQNEARGGVD